MYLSYCVVVANPTWPTHMMSAFAGGDRNGCFQPMFSWLAFTTLKNTLSDKLLRQGRQWLVVELRIIPHNESKTMDYQYINFSMATNVQSQHSLFNISECFNPRIFSSGYKTAASDVR